MQNFGVKPSRKAANWKIEEFDEKLSDVVCFIELRFENVTYNCWFRIGCTGEVGKGDVGVSRFCCWAVRTGFVNSTARTQKVGRTSQVIAKIPEKAVTLNS